MPSLHQTVDSPWSDGATIHLGSVDLPWKDGATIHATPSTFTPGSPPGGGTVTGPTAGAALYTIASRATYDVPHTMAVTDLRDNTALEVESLTVSIDEDSAMWTLRAAGGESLYAKLTTGVQPAEVEVNLDGETWVFVIDTVSRSRTFGDSQVSVSGRSLAVAAGSPYEADQNWVNDGPTTGAQLAALANLYTGLSVSWEVEDWLIPDRVFSYSGTPLSVVLRVAEAVGAMVQAGRTDYSVRVMPRYSLMPNEWATVAPDVEVAFAAVLSEQFERADRPEYTGVYVSGQQQGAVGFVRLAGTSGSNLHPLITDLLLTEEPALRQRGMAVLGASGGQARVSLGLPLLTGAGEPGVLSVGQLVRVLDPAGTWTGVVRAVSVAAQLPTVTQTVVLERHTKDVEGSVSDGVLGLDPIVFGTEDTGPGTGAFVPDQVAVVGTPFSLALAGYWTGGTTPYTWSMRSGTLPDGLTLDAATGVVSGTPTVDGTFAGVAFRAVDAEYGMVDSNEVEFVVSDGIVGGLWVAVANGGTQRVMTSPDGETWTLQTPSADNQWTGVVWTGTQFVAVAANGTDRVMTSPDGVAWTGRTAAAAKVWTGIAYGAGTLVAVSFDGVGDQVMTSTDGITWTGRTTPGTNYPYSSVTYGAGVFVAVASAGTAGSRVMTSPDGITWTQRSSLGGVDGPWRDVTYAATLGLFIAVAQGNTAGGSKQVMTSPDGITWTERTSASGTTWWTAVAAKGSRLVAVSDTNQSPYVPMYSDDGITWSAGTPAASNNWRGVRTNGAIFVAVANSGAGNRVMTSPDGVTWTAQASAADNAWQDLAFAEGL